MRFYHFEIVIEKEPDGPGYLAYSPTLPGCFSNGQTVEDAKRNIREAIQQHLEVLQEKGEPIPQPGTGNPPNARNAPQARNPRGASRAPLAPRPFPAYPGITPAPGRPEER